MPGAVLPREPRTPREIFEHYLRDLVYGANDGLITTFAIVAGVAGADLSTRVVLILGFANRLAVGFSRGASNYLSSRSEQELLAATDTGAREPHAFRHGVATFAAFVVIGLVPLIAYLLPIPPERRFRTAALLTLLALFGVGASRALVTRLRWWSAGLEMLLVGGAAATVAYLVGRFLAGITGGPVV